MGTKNILHGIKNLKNTREWFEDNDPILFDGQIGIIEDNINKQIVIGDGESNFNNLILYNLITIDNKLYVDPINGLDEIGYGSINKPYRTIQYTINNLPLNSNKVYIYLADGEYKENIIIMSSIQLYIFGNFTDPSRVIIGNATVQQPQPITITFDNQSSGIVSLNYLTIRDNQLSYMGDISHYNIRTFLGSILYINNCYFQYSNNKVVVMQIEYNSSAYLKNCKFIGTICDRLISCFCSGIIFLESGNTINPCTVMNSLISNYNCSTIYIIANNSLILNSGIITGRRYDVGTNSIITNYSYLPTTTVDGIISNGGIVY
jgi:hypothetical protein